MSLLVREPNVPAERFSVRIREATRDDHERAERSTFISALLDGRVSRAGFAALTGQLSFIYDALDSGAGLLLGDPIVGRFLDPRLARGPALDADLTELVGIDWREQVTAGPATVAHADRIRHLARTWPGGYLAHHYIRYLGDLSGGKVIGKTVQRVYGLSDAGVRFYRFDTIPSAREFKEAYRQLLDDAPWSEDERRRILDEANLGFRMTGEIFDDLDGGGFVRS